MTGQSPSKNVLVIEDDLDIRDLVIQVLEDEGHRGVGVANGVEGLRYLRQTAHKPFLILLDLMMPEMDGWQFQAELQREPSLASIPLVVFTADGRPSSIAAAGYLLKPLSVQTLIDTVERFAAQAG